MSDPDKPRKFRRFTAEVRARMLVDAGLRVLAKGGITAFTIDNICAEAQASRGLVTHHFGSKDGLLAAVHATAYAPIIESLKGDEEAPRSLGEIIAQSFAPENFTRESLNTWLALWSEIAVKPGLLHEHRRLLTAYRRSLARAVAEAAARNGRSVDAPRVASTIISLIDGLWLEQCIDPEASTPEEAHRACLGMIEPLVGPV